MLPQASAYVQSYADETKWMHFLMEDGELLKKYNKKSGIKSAILLKKDLIVNHSTVKIFKN